MDIQEKQNVYDNASAIIATAKTLDQFYEAIVLLESLNGYKDSEEKIADCREQIKELKQRKQQERIIEQNAINEAEQKKEEKEKKQIKEKKKKTFLTIVCVVFAILILAAVMYYFGVIQPANYNKAKEEMKNGHYQTAYQLLSSYKDDYEDIKSLKIECNYQIALTYLEDGKDKEAYKLFNKLGSYKDSLKRVNEIFWKHRDYLEKGNHLLFGQYEQDVIAEGSSPIEWIAVARKDKKVLLVSSKVLFFAKMCSGGYTNTNWEEYTSWKKSSVRSKLNDNFYKIAFNKEEKKIILKTKVENCIDSVFILSLDEQQKYLSNSEKKCLFANEPKLDKYEQDNEAYWLREKANYQYGSATISAYNKDGSIENYYTMAYCGVRPAIWVDTSK